MRLKRSSRIKKKKNEETLNCTEKEKSLTPNCDFRRYRIICRTIPLYQVSRGGYPKPREQMVRNHDSESREKQRRKQIPTCEEIG